MALIVPTALEPAWQAALERAAHRTVQPRALGLVVERVSRRYHGEADVVIARGDELAARTLFFLPRDLQKVALPVAELARAGAFGDAPLRVLDVGAGVGASTVGLLRAAQGRFAVARVECVDADADTLATLERVVAEASSAGLLGERVPPVVVRRGDVRTGVEALGDANAFDLVLASAVLVEMVEGDEAARGAALAAHIERIARHTLAPGGALVVIEPATRDATRALHLARAALIERGLYVFAPCTHQGACPMLERERDWCHEDLDTDLPEWLHPVAREAGLRWQGLTFSYLTVRLDGAHSVGALVDAGAGANVVAVRVVSTPRSTKGKTEAFISGPLADAGKVTGARVMQLDRDVKRAPDDALSLEACARGDVLALASDVAARAGEGRPLRVAPGQIAKARDDSAE